MVLVLLNSLQHPWLLCLITNICTNLFAEYLMQAKERLRGVPLLALVRNNTFWKVPSR